MYAKILAVAIFLAGTANCWGNAGTISLSKSTWNAGAVTCTIGTNSASVTITNTGSVSVTVNSLTLARTNDPHDEFGYVASLPKAITAHGTSTFTVTFNPTAGGNAAATLTVLSTATNSPTVGLSGFGQHQVVLNWTASTSVTDPCYSNLTYNVYFSTTSGSYTSPYASRLTATTFTDNFNVVAGQVNYYVVTAYAYYTNNGGSCNTGTSGWYESTYSSETVATIPNP